MAKVFDAMAKLSNGTNATAFTARSDGITCTLHEDKIISYGGVVGHKVWVLNLASLAWHEVDCTGVIPASRIYHTAVQYGDHMLVYGGELLHTSSADLGHDVEPSPPYHELDLETFEWCQTQTFGDSPGNRSHHTATVHKGKMYILGGRRTAPGEGNGNYTMKDLRQDKASGFFDIFVLDVMSKTWARIERFDEGHPMLWGHSAVMFRHYLLVFGGFDVSQEGADESVPGGPPLPDDAPPSCELSNVVHIWDTETLKWSKASPKGATVPVERSLHVAEIYGGEMVIFGGMTIDRAGRSVNVNDAWVWNVGTGTWEQLEFCLPYWPSKRLISCLHPPRLIVCHEMTSINVLDLTNKDLGWVKVPCDPTSLYHEPLPSLPPRKAIPCPDLPPAPPQPPHPGHREPADEVPHYPAHPVRMPGAVPLPPPLPSPSHSPQPVHRIKVRTPSPPPAAPLAPAVEPCPPPAHPQDPAPRVRRMMQERAEQQALELQMAEKARQDEMINMLQHQIKELRGQLDDLNRVRGRGFEGTDRGRDPMIGAATPITPGTSLHAVQVGQLQDYLDKLQSTQDDIREKQRRIQEEYQEQLKRMHSEHISLIQQRQHAHQLAQEQMSAIQATEEQEQRQKDQLELIRAQHEQLLELQRAAKSPPRQTEPSPVLPPAAVSMMEAIVGLSSIGAPRTAPVREDPQEVDRQRLVNQHLDAMSLRSTSPPRPQNPSPFAQPHPSAVGYGVGPAAPHSMMPSPMASPNVAPTRDDPSLRRLRHIENLKQQLMVMDATLQAPNTTLSASPAPKPNAAFGRPFPSKVPPRGTSASSSPGQYWDRLKNILGDEYVAIGPDAMGLLLSPTGSYAGSPPPRGEAVMEAEGGVRHV